MLYDIIVIQRSYEKHKIRGGQVDWIQLGDELCDNTFKSYVSQFFLPPLTSILKCSDDGVLKSGLLSFWTCLYSGILNTTCS